MLAQKANMFIITILASIYLSSNDLSVKAFEQPGELK